MEKVNDEYVKIPRETLEKLRKGLAEMLEILKGEKN